MNDQGVCALPVRDNTQALLGMATHHEIITKVCMKKCTNKDAVSIAVTKEFRHMSSHIPLFELARVFEKQEYVFVDKKWIVTNKHLVNFMAQQE